MATAVISVDSDDPTDPQALHRQIEALRNRVETLTDRVAELEAECEHEKNRIDGLETETDRLERRLTECESETSRTERAPKAALEKADANETRLQRWEWHVRILLTLVRRPRVPVFDPPDFGNTYTADYCTSEPMGKIGTQVNTENSSTELTLSATAEWKRNTEKTPVCAVVSAVADASGMDMVELPPLYEAIDPDALNALFTGRSEPAVGQVSFRYAGYDVVVRGTGVVRVRTVVDA